MRHLPPWAPFVAVAAAVAIVAFLLLRHAGAGKADAEPQAVASVTVAAVRAGSLSDVVVAPGVIQAAAGASLTIASPKAAVVTRVSVGLGEAVRAGEPLITLADAPAAQLAYRQAADAAAFAQNDLVRVRRMLDEHLATNEQLSAAEKTLADAKAALEAQRTQGAGRPAQVIVAPAAGVVTALSAAVGDHVAQDAALLSLAPEGRLAAKLSIEPADAARVAPGQAVELKPVFGGAPVSSRLGAVARQADPATRAIDAAAPLGAAWPVGAAVQAQIITGAHQGLTVPRAAVVFDETGPHLFTVSGGKAHRVFVTVGADHDQDIEVRGAIDAGTLVAVQGAYELQDGMGVRIGPK